jgi:hypothetical protein
MTVLRSAAPALVMAVIVGTVTSCPKPPPVVPPKPETATPKATEPAPPPVKRPTPPEDQGAVPEIPAPSSPEPRGPSRVSRALTPSQPTPSSQSMIAFCTCRRFSA